MPTAVDSSETDCLSDELVLRFVSGAGSSSEEARVQAHIDGCANCRAALAEAGKLLLEEDDGAGVRTVADGAPARTRHLEEEVTSTLRPGDRVGRYLIERPLGVGGMGVVYAAQDPSLHRSVALKILRPDAPAHESTATAHARLLREAQAMAKLSHPNVVTIYDVGEFDAKVFLAMELVDGTTLRRWQKERPRSPGEILGAFLEAGRGIAAAHAAGLVHLDFKPDNVLVGRDGRIRVTDFGLARGARAEPTPGPHPGASVPAMDESLLWKSLTATGLFKGTPTYMAPEQFRRKDLDARTDQFAFCVALYEALFGQRPFDGETPGELIASVLEGRPRPIPQSADALPKALAPLLFRGMAVDPNQRFADMPELLRELTRATEPAKRGRLGLWVGAGAIGAAVLAGGVLAAVHFTPRPEPVRTVVVLPPPDPPTPPRPAETVAPEIPPAWPPAVAAPAKRPPAHKSAPHHRPVHSDLEEPAFVRGR